MCGDEEAMEYELRGGVSKQVELMGCYVEVMER